MDDQTEPSNFEATLEEQERVGVVSARGELDLSSAYELQAKLDEAITQCSLAGGSGSGPKPRAVHGLHNS